MLQFLSSLELLVKRRSLRVARVCTIAWCIDTRVHVSSSTLTKWSLIVARWYTCCFLSRCKNNTLHRSATPFFVWVLHVNSNSITYTTVRFRNLRMSTPCAFVHTHVRACTCLHSWNVCFKQKLALMLEYAC